MNIRNKIKKSDPDLVVLHYAGADPIIIDRRRATSVEVHRLVDKFEWTACEARTKDGHTLWLVERDEVDDPAEADAAGGLNLPDPTIRELERAMQDAPASGGAEAAYPERFLRLMILAQQSNSAGYQRQIEVLLNTFVNATERSQELLEQQHEMILAQREQIQQLMEKSEDDNEKPAEDSKIAGIVEALAPVVLPLLMQAQQKQQQVAAPPAAASVLKGT